MRGQDISQVQQLSNKHKLSVLLCNDGVWSGRWGKPQEDLVLGTQFLLLFSRLVS